MADAIIGFVPAQRNRAYRKAFGQHFLVDARAADRIVEIFDLQPGQGVLEIGPGPGVLTRRVAPHAAPLVAVEVDPKLAFSLQREFVEAEGIHIVEADALKVELDQLPFPPASKIRVLSNLPYSVATPILQRLLEWSRVQDLVIMVQKEVADRIQAAPGSPERGFFSVFCRYHCARIHRHFILGPGAFRPPPKVDSAVLELEVRTSKPLEAKEYEGFLKLVSSGFAHRRKTLYNNLRRVKQMDSALWRNICRDLALDSKVRAEDLSLEDWISLHSLTHRQQP